MEGVGCVWDAGESSPSVQFDDDAGSATLPADGRNSIAIASTGFRAGRHYWEWTVGGELSDCTAVGLALKPIKRRHASCVRAPASPLVGLAKL